LPAIVTDIPGNTAVIQHGFNGLVVPVGDAVALARAIVEMHRSTELRERLGHAARQQAEARFAISRVAEQLEELYHTALVATTPDGFQD
jgi:glycosyltransferase involved in cell wall biosynthesis